MTIRERKAFLMKAINVADQFCNFNSDKNILISELGAIFCYDDESRLDAGLCDGLGNALS